MPSRLRKPLDKPTVKLRRGKGHRNTAQYVEGYHAVEKKVVLALSDYLSLAIFGNENRELL